MTAEEALAALKTGAHTSLSEKTTWVFRGLPGPAARHDVFRKVMP